MEALQADGHEVALVHPTQRIDWKTFDAVHLFQHGQWCAPLIEDLAATGVATFLSPIIDPPRPYGRLPALMSRIPFEKMRLSQNQRLLRQYGQTGVHFLSRSEIETKSLRACGVPANSVRDVPISMSHDWLIDDHTVRQSPRNGAVLHVSHLDQPRKNVRQLVEAAIRLGFTLRLAGSIADKDFASWLCTIQDRHQNISYLGRISDQELRHEMLTASVFCLPSLFEGVGLVALDAGFCGCRIVATNRGGTVDYLGGQAILIDPLQAGALDESLRAALAAETPDMAVRAHVIANFTKVASARRLASTYSAVLAS